ncbi:MAG: hypothetical protein AB8V06_00465 [Francisella endosymbiont of Hyalomma asiaticum]
MSEEIISSSEYLRLNTTNKSPNKFVRRVLYERVKPEKETSLKAPKAVIGTRKAITDHL